MKITLGLIAFCIIIIFASCTNKLPDGKTNSNPTSQIPVNEFGKVLTLKYGESIIVGKENLKISFREIQDSRCPKKVNCMTEGKAKVQLQVEAKDLNETIQLVAKGLCFKMDGSCGNQAMVNDYKFQLLNVDPYPIEKIVGKASNVVMFKVTK